MVPVMRTLYFVRHGESEHNVDGLFAGDTDTPLTKRGKKQAKQAGQKAKNLDIDLIISSPLARAYDTAKLMAQEIGYKPDKIILSNLLKERYYGTAEGTPYSADKDHLNNFEHYESDEEIEARAKELLAWLQSLPAENILVVSHGAIGRRLRQLLKPDYNFYERIPNTKLEKWL
jgi:uncharacterized phosphatase